MAEKMGSENIHRVFSDKTVAFDEYQIDVFGKPTDNGYIFCAVDVLGGGDVDSVLVDGQQMRLLRKAFPERGRQISQWYAEVWTQVYCVIARVRYDVTPVVMARAEFLSREEVAQLLDSKQSRPNA